MESLITSYGINFQDFCYTLQSLQAVVAGSAALAEYLKQEGIEPGYRPNDLDIFVPGHIQTVIYRDGSRIHLRKPIIKSLNTMTDFLTANGFHQSDKFGDENFQHYYRSNLSKILRVTSFVNQAGKEIQIINIDTFEVVKHISKDFDLSACVTWYNLESGRFQTLNPDCTKRKEMYLIQGGSRDRLSYKDAMRIQKYEERGFTLITRPIMPPCTQGGTRDNRALLSEAKFDDIQVTDIFTLEETTLREHLQASPWNIVIKAGEQYYAFERKALMNYLNTKKFSLPHISELCETPFNQSITKRAYLQLQYGDYSIYELSNAYSVPTYGGRVKSLCHLTCYSVADWVENKDGKACMVPAAPAVPVASLIPAHPADSPMLPPGPPILVRHNSYQPLRAADFDSEGLSASSAARALQPAAAPVPELNELRTNLADVIAVIGADVDEVIAAHAHLIEPGRLEAFQNSVQAAVQELALIN